MMTRTEKYKKLREEIESESREEETKASALYIQFSECFDLLENMVSEVKRYGKKKRKIGY